jgi:hypothetical protein
MNIRVRIFILVYVAFHLSINTACNTESQLSNQASIRESEFTIEPAFEELNLMEPVDIEEYNGNYYILDSKLSTIKVIDVKNSSYKYSIGQLGQGHVEFFNPGYLKVTNGNMAVFEHRNRRIQLININGEYINELPDSPFPWKSFCLNSKGEIILGQPQHGMLYTVYDNMGNKMRTFGALKEPSELFGKCASEINAQYKQAVNYTVSCTDGDDNIYSVHIFAPLIEKYDRHGNLLGSAVIKGKEISYYKDIFHSISKDNTRLLKTVLDGVTIYNFFLSVAIDPNNSDLLVLTGLGNLFIYDSRTLKKKTEIKIDHSFVPRFHI